MVVRITRQVKMPTSARAVISSRYFNEGDKTDVCLDLIHELVHIRQHSERKELFEENYGYVDRPTEIEAYEITIKEDRRL